MIDAMAVLDHKRFALIKDDPDGKPYSVRRSMVIIAGLSLSFWGLLGFALYRVL